MANGNKREKTLQDRKGADQEKRKNRQDQAKEEKSQDRAENQDGKSRDREDYWSGSGTRLSHHQLSTRALCHDFKFWFGVERGGQRQYILHTKCPNTM